jgi:endo-1,4-beta-D-glucanase Y
MTEERALKSRVQGWFRMAAERCRRPLARAGAVGPRSYGRVAAWTLLLGVTLPAAQGCKAQQQPWPLWESYGKRFLDDQGRVIDRSAGDRTTSEGEAYALFFALVDNDRSHFDKLVSWTEANLAGGDLTARLPGWRWGKSESGEWKMLDANSASDADLWMAYSLMEAGRLWHDPRYAKLGKTMAERVARQEVVLVAGLGTTLAPGTEGFHPDQQTWILNPSYLPLPVLTYLAHVMPREPWSSVLESLPSLVGGSVSHGFAMDWLSAGPEGVKPSGPPREPTAGQREAQISGSYDAIRVYLWTGMADSSTPGAKRLIGQLNGMTQYLQGAVTPPLEVDSSGKVLRAEGTPGFSAAVIPFLEAAGQRVAATRQQDRLAATRIPATGLYGNGAEYYDQNLALFSTGWSERRFRFERDGRLKLRWK